MKTLFKDFSTKQCFLYTHDKFQSYQRKNESSRENTIMNSCAFFITQNLCALNLTGRISRCPELQGIELRA